MTLSKEKLFSDLGSERGKSELLFKPGRALMGFRKSTRCRGFFVAQINRIKTCMCKI